jgi:tetratricopeptide (TPR) repeat protein
VALLLACAACDSASAYINAGFRTAGDAREAQRLGIENADHYYAYKAGRRLLGDIRAAQRAREEARQLRQKESAKILDAIRAERLAQEIKRSISETAGDHTDPVRLYQRGIKYAESRFWREAEADFEAAIRLDPEFGRAYYWRARCRWRQDKYAPAIADYERAIKLEPSFPPAYLVAALAYATCDSEKLRDPARALKLAEQACALTNHENPVCLQTTAVVHAWNGNFDEAVRWQTNAIKLISPEDRYNRHWAHALLEELQQGRKVSPYSTEIDKVRMPAAKEPR